MHLKISNAQYETDNNMELPNEFTVSDYAVKDEKKYFKHVLKLDKNFHVYIHGEKKYIRKGYDPDRDMTIICCIFEMKNSLIMKICP